MAEPSRNATSDPPGNEPSRLRPRYRLRFRKAGDLRLVSHHDLMHVFERMLRRAALPIAHTQGFHPQPRMVFALSLALGVAGTNEVLELELTEPLEPSALQERLALQAPPGLEILSCRLLEGKSSPLVRRAFYRLPLEPGDDASAPPVPVDLPERCTDLLAQPHLWVERSRPQPRRLDIRPYLDELGVYENQLEMAVWVTPTGTARPEEFARFLGLGPLLEAGTYFERSNLEMLDEVQAPMPALAPSESTPTSEGPESAPAAKHEGRPTAIMSGPLSFDS